MINLYLWINAAMYVAFAAWCTFAPARTAEAVGFTTLSRSGVSEYLVVYGGLQLGLGLFFAYCARTGQGKVGLLFALAMYAPIVAYRSVTLLRQWPVSSTTVAVAVLEVLLLVSALALWFSQRSEL